MKDAPHLKKSGLRMEPHLAYIFGGEPSKSRKKFLCPRAGGPFLNSSRPRITFLLPVYTTQLRSTKVLPVAPAFHQARWLLNLSGPKKRRQRVLNVWSVFLDFSGPTVFSRWLLVCTTFPKRFLAPTCLRFLYVFYLILGTQKWPTKNEKKTFSASVQNSRGTFSTFFERFSRFSEWF